MVDPPTNKSHSTPHTGSISTGRSRCKFLFHVQFFSVSPDTEGFAVNLTQVQDKQFTGTYLPLLPVCSEAELYMNCDNLNSK